MCHKKIGKENEKKSEKKDRVMARLKPHKRISKNKRKIKPVIPKRKQAIVTMGNRQRRVIATIKKPRIIPNRRRHYQSFDSEDNDEIVFGR
jgi:hypothetical protein